MTGPLEPQILDGISISQSDLATFGLWASCTLWINNTRAIVHPTNYTTLTEIECVEPAIAFPFTRLASVTLLDGTETFLYHQINETTLAEEHFLSRLSTWAPSQYITIIND